MLALDAAALAAAALALAITALAKPSEAITAASLATTTLTASNTPEECGAHADGQRKRQRLLRHVRPPGLDCSQRWR